MASDGRRLARFALLQDPAGRHSGEAGRAGGGAGGNGREEDPHESLARGRKRDPGVPQSRPRAANGRTIVWGRGGGGGGG